MLEKLSVVDLVSYAQQCIECKQFDEALRATGLLLEKDPINAEFMLYRLQALDGQGKILEDIGFIQHYVSCRTSDITGLLLLYQAYLQRGDTNGALLSLVFALSIDSNDESCLSLFVELLKNINPNYKHVRVNKITTDRIGHLTTEIEPLLRKSSTEEQDCLYIFLGNPTDVANRYVYGLLKGVANVVEDEFWNSLYITRPKLLSDYFFGEFPYDNSNMVRGVPAVEINQKGYKNLISIYDNHSSFITLPDNDVDFAESLLNQMNIKADDKVVCLHVRDSHYLTNKFGGEYYSYHDFRDADIDSYLPAVEYLLSQGYKVIRIGNTSDQSLDINSENYFDFCRKPHPRYSELLEVYLLKRCEFFIGTFSGPAGTACMFDTPSLLVNSVPYMHPYLKYCRFIPKKIFQHGKPISFSKIINGLKLNDRVNTPFMFVSNKQTLDDEGYTVQDNSAEDILNAVVEFSSIVDKRAMNAHLSEKQKAYMNNLPEDFLFKNCLGLVCDSYLIDHAEWFE